MVFSSYTVPAELFTEYRYKACAAHQRAKGKLDEIDREFGKKFGRSYGGQIEEYRTEDADVVIVTMGCSTGTAKVVVDRKREEGVNVGLVKVRMFRPSPRERLLKVLNGKKAVGVIDRSVCYAWGCGHNFVELKALLGDLSGRPRSCLISSAAWPGLTSLISTLHGSSTVPWLPRKRWLQQRP
jgi:pyruvate/2-oxoacid:ferredoxin oxidoreductase alpha subunit